MPSYRPKLWASVPLGHVARVAAFQIAASAVAIGHTEPGSLGRLAIMLAAVLAVVTLPLGKLAARLSRDHPNVYYWSGRVWTAAVPVIIAMTMGDAYDGTGLAFAESVCAPPYALAALVGVSFALGAQGALLNVPRDAVGNIAAMLLAISVIKLNAVYSRAYLALHVFGLGSVFLGYAVVVKYADLHEAVREAAEAVVSGAAAREPFVVTDVRLHILAVNKRLLDVLGYEADELVGRPVMELVTEANEEGLANDHAWVRRTLFEAASRGECPNGHVWSVRAKNGGWQSVRITLGDTRCPVNGTKMFTAMFSCMRLEQRNAQLRAEKERLEWDLASSYNDGDWEDPRELLGATALQGTHRTLGAMQDQDKTDEAVSCAHSFDHVNSSASPPAPPRRAFGGGAVSAAGATPPTSDATAATSSASPTVPGHTLIASARPKTPSPGTSCVSLQSSVMDTISEAAKKSPTRAPPPTKKESRLPRRTKVCSEPSSSSTKPKAGNKKNAPPKRAVPAVERVESDSREYS